MVILVTGGCGYIGSQLIRELPGKFENETIRIIDNMIREKYVSLWNLPKKCKYEFFEGDITKEDDIRKAMRDVEIVFDLAGITNAPLSFQRKELTMEVNVGGVQKILKECLNNGVKKYVYTSSASVYGPTTNEADENYECKPISPYGESKLLAEKEIQKTIDENGLNISILRLGTVHGWSIGMRFDTVIDRFVFQSCIGLPMTIWEVNKNEKRPYLHVKDASRALIYSSNNKIKGIFNVVSENAKLMDVVETIRNLIPNSSVIFTKKKNLNQLSYTLSSSKFKKNGFKFNYKIKDGVREIAEKFEALMR